MIVKLCLRTKHGLKVFESRVLRKVFGPKRDEVNRRMESTAWSAFFTKFHLGDEIKKNEIGGPCSTHGGEERCIQGFGGET